MRLEEHPTVKWFRENQGDRDSQRNEKVVEAEDLRRICLSEGADDAGFVEIDREGVAEEKEDLLAIMPDARAVIGLVFRLNRQALRTLAHSITNLEFHQTWKHANNSARRIVRQLQDRGINAMNAPAGFPYEADRWPDKMWTTNDKIVAMEAGLGHMGWNRIVLHPQFGAFVALGTVVMDAEISAYDTPLDFNPCVECKLCVSVCPVGAVGRDGDFNFLSCYTHNYRERLGGFLNWVETVATSRSVPDYRRRVTDAETVSMWQNLSIGAQTRCDRCMGICPAGQESIGSYLNDRASYTDLVRRMREKEETIYVVPGSDAADHSKTKFPNKTIKNVSNGVRPNSVSSFLRTLPIAFQKDQSEGLNATYHFTFTGDEECTGSAVIRERTIEVHDGHVGDPDFHLTADSATWIGFLSKERNMLWAMLTGKIKKKGPMKLMMAFAKCFPS